MSNPPPNDSPDTRKPPAARQVPVAGRPLRRKLLFGAFTTLAFFALLEMALIALDIEPASRQPDPFVGFSSQSRLFTEGKAESGEPILETAENRLTLFNRQSFLRDKPQDCCRIFCLGGSTTYGRPYDDRTSFAGFLRAFLPEMDPTRRWEVVNAGGISYASYRIEVLIRELKEYQPDLFVIYTGHNEFLEDQTYSTLMSTPEPVRRAVGLARWSRTFALMQRVLHPDVPPPGRQTLPEEVDAVLDRSVGPAAYHRNERRREEVLSRFRSALERIADAARDADAKLILVVPASNLRDCSPFKSEHRDGLTNEELRQFLADLRAGEEALRDGRTEEALSRLDRVVGIDPRHAQAHFLRGRALLERGDAAGALEAFVRAREEDVCPLRAFEEIQEIVRDVAKRRGIPVIDFASIIACESQYGIAGADWFLDHVHPTINGNQLLARRLAEEMVTMKILRPQPSWDSDGFHQIGLQVQARIDPRQHATALRNLAKVLSWAGKVDEADRLSLKAAEHLPDDVEALRMTGFARLRLNQVAEAKSCFEAALHIQPDDVRALTGLGDVYTRLGEHVAARDCFSRAATIDPKHVPALFNLGNALRNLGQFQEAEVAYRESLAVAPDQPDAHKNLGLALFAQGNIAGTVREFEAALALEKSVPQRHAELGFVLIDAGDRQRAEAEFREALAIDPSFVFAMIGLALLYEQHGDLSRADEMIRDALRIAPNDANLHFSLAQYALQRGDVKTAKAELDLVLKLDPDHAEARRLRDTMD